MTTSLKDKRILMVEDDFLSGMHLEQGLRQLGCIPIGPCVSVEEAMLAVADNELDAAILDVKIHGGTSLPIVEALRVRGVPFLYLTGYQASAVLPEGDPPVRVVAKPASIEELAGALVDCLDRKATSDQAAADGS